MKCLVLCLAALAIGTCAQDDPEKKSPVTEVVQLLQKLQTNILNDEKAETLIYKKFACWCVTQSKKVAEDIGVARDTMDELQRNILSHRSLIAVLTQEIAQLEEEIAANKEAQAKATAAREKEHEEFVAESSETQQALAALTKAIEVLKKGTSFLQVDASRGEVAKVISALPINSPVDSKHLSLLSEFLKTDSRYAPQSMTVQGILKDMFTTFARNLMRADEEEANAQYVYEDFIAVKTEELEQAEKTKEEKEKEKAEADEKLAELVRDYDDTKKQMEIDIKFFDETKEQCIAKKDEWVIRVQNRDAELSGIKKALAVLTDPENRKHFAKSIKPGKETIQDSNVRDGAQADAGVSLLQTGSTAAAMKAYGTIKSLATKMHSLRLASLAFLVRSSKSGHFDKVIAAIDTMLKTLAEEGAADVKKRDTCKKDYTDIASKQEDLKWKIKNHVAFIEKMDKQIAELEAERVVTIDEINATTDAITEMQKAREAEHEVFLQAKLDDEHSIDLLTQARDFLEEYFKKNGGEGVGEVQGSVKGALVQTEPVFEVSNRQAPDATFSHKHSRKAQSKGVVSLITMIIEDAQDEIKQAIADENKSQYQYQKARETAEQKVEELEAKVVNIDENIADREKQKQAEQQQMRTNNGFLRAENKRKADIKPDCDWIINSFTERATARQREMEGLTSAKEYLAGAAPSAFIQNDANKLEQIGFVHLHN